MEISLIGLADHLGSHAAGWWDDRSASQRLLKCQSKLPIGIWTNWSHNGDLNGQFLIRKNNQNLVKEHVSSARMKNDNSFVLWLKILCHRHWSAQTLVVPGPHESVPDVQTWDWCWPCHQTLNIFPILWTIPLNYKLKKKKTAVRNNFLLQHDLNNPAPAHKLHRPQVFAAATVKCTVCGPYLSYFVSLGA